MARVIKDPEGHKQVKCRECLVTVEYAPIEVKTHTYYCMGDSDTDYYIPCPNCNEKIIVKGKY